MSIGSSFTRARCQVVSPDVTNEWIEERLNAGAFKGIPDSANVGVGFAPFDKPERREHWELEHAKGEYTAFYFVKHQKRVPAAVLRMRCNEEAEKYEAENGRRPSASAMTNIREAVAAKLTEQAFPIPTGFPVIWHTGSGRMLLGTTSAGLIDDFLKHFEKVFQLYPQFTFHSRWALDLIPDWRQKDKLKAQFAFEAPTAVHEGRQLGNDFLTYLWFQSEREPGPFKVGDKEARVDLENSLVLVHPKERTDRVVCVTSNDQLPEAREAIRQGKLVDEARIWFEYGGLEYELRLDSTLQYLRSVKLPKVARDPNGDALDAEGYFLERMYHIGAIQEVLDALYLKFLGERLSPTWERSIWSMIEEWFRRAEEAA